MACKEESVELEPWRKRNVKDLFHVRIQTFFTKEEGGGEFREGYLGLPRLEWWRWMSEAYDKIIYPFCPHKSFSSKNI